MSRPEAHHQDYDHPDYGTLMWDYMDIPRDGGLREGGPGGRDYGAQEFGSSKFYKSSYSA